MKTDRPLSTPADLAAALQARGLLAFFEDCTRAHRRQYLDWIGQAKKPATRRARIDSAVEMIAKKAAEEDRT
jgi:uncharacterized protein YdeI (YjbR/CyaY-like superfamily)